MRFLQKSSESFLLPVEISGKQVDFHAAVITMNTAIIVSNSIFINCDV